MADFKVHVRVGEASLVVEDTRTIFDTPAAARYLGKSVQTIKYHLKRGNLKPDGKVGSNNFFYQSTLDRLEADHCY